MEGGARIEADEEVNLVSGTGSVANVSSFGRQHVAVSKALFPVVW